MPIRLSGMVSGLDTDAIVKELMSAQSQKKVKVQNNKTQAEWKKEIWDELNTKIYALYTEKLSSLKLQGTYLTKKAESSNSDKVGASATNASNGSYTVEVKSVASAQYVTGADISSKGLTKDSTLVSAGMSAGQTIVVKTGKDLDKEYRYTVTADSKVSDFTSMLQSQGLNASFDNATGRFYISSKETGKDNKFTMVSEGAAAGTDLTALGLQDITVTEAENGKAAASSSEVAVIAGSDAEVILNGATINSSSNTIQTNGLTIEAKAKTSAGEKINISVSNNTEGVYDKVKEFVKSYNELVTEMYTKYSAKRAKGYDMLTDEQKKEMSDEQVELWEDKIKSTLLRRDDTLNSLLNTFRSKLQETVTVDGTAYSLSSFGIVSGDYSEHGKIHINGNIEDSFYGSKEDQLKKALDENPEAVSKAMSKIMEGVYNSLTEAMSASKISSALTFYNDKQLQTQIDDYEKELTKWETRLTDLEERYYKQYSKMESAIAKLQSEQNSLAGFLGN